MEIFSRQKHPQFKIIRIPGAAAAVEAGKDMASDAAEAVEATKEGSTQ